MEKPARGLKGLFHLHRDAAAAVEVPAPTSATEVRLPRQPRRDKRDLAPYGSSTIQGEIETPSGPSIQVTLWDLSKAGVCVLAQGPIAVPVHSQVRVSFHDGLGQETVGLDEVLEWKDRDGTTTFAGLMFVGDTSAINGSFLAHFLHT